MKKYRCVKNYFFNDDFRHQLGVLCFTKDEIYPVKDDDYDGMGILFVDNVGDDHFMCHETRKEFFVPIKDFKYGKKSK